MQTNLENENHCPVLTLEDVKALGDKGSGPVERIFNVAQKKNKLRNSDLEEMTKN